MRGATFVIGKMLLLHRVTDELQSDAAHAGAARLRSASLWPGGRFPTNGTLSRVAGRNNGCRGRIAGCLDLAR
jgi:hypothetical protein